MALDKLLNFAEPQIPHPYSVTNNITSEGCCEGKMAKFIKCPEVWCLVLFKDTVNVTDKQLTHIFFFFFDFAISQPLERQQDAPGHGIDVTVSLNLSLIAKRPRMWRR